MKTFDIERLTLSPSGAKLLREVCSKGWCWMPRFGAINRLYVLAIEELVDKGILKPDGETPTGNSRYTLTGTGLEHREGLDVLAMLTIEGRDD